MKDGDRFLQRLSIQREYEIYKRDQYWWRGYCITDCVLDTEGLNKAYPMKVNKFALCKH